MSFRPKNINSERKFYADALEVSSGSMEDLRRDHYLGQLGITDGVYPDIEFKWLGQQDGVTATTIQGRWEQFLTNEGYTGTLTEKLKKYYDEGFFSILGLNPTLYLNPASSAQTLYSDAAADFDDANSEYLSIDDGAGGDFDFGSDDRSFSIFFWVYLDDKSNDYSFCGKFDKAGSRLYQISYDVSSDELRFSTSSDGTSLTITQLGISAISSGTWFPIFCKYDSSSDTQTISAHNGTAWISSSDTGITSIHSANIPFTIGSNLNSGTPSDKFDGGIDEMSVFNRLLTDTERDWLYNSGNGRTWTDVESAGVIDTVDLTDNLVAYWGLDEASGTRADSSGNEHHLTDNNTVGVRDGIASGLAEDNNDSISLWNDSSGNGNNAVQGTVASRPTLSESQSLAFDGTDDEVDIGTGIIDTSDGTQPYTVTAWVKTTSTDAADKVVLSQYTAAEDSFTFSVRIGEIEYFKDRGASADIDIETSGANLNDGQWHLVGFTKESDGTVTLLADGASTGVTGTDTNPAVSTDTLIGGQFNFEGNMKDVRIYERAISVSEFADLYAGNEIDSTNLVSRYEFNGDYTDTQGNNDGTSGGNPTFSSDIPAVFIDGARRSVLFDGSGDFIATATYKGILGTGAKSVVVWFNTTDTNTVDNNLIAWGDIGTSGALVNFSCENGVMWGRFSSNIAYGGSGYNDGDWHMGVLVVPANATVANVKIYVDGSDLGALTTSGNTALNTLESETVHIGSNMVENNLWFDGKIGHTFIVAKELSLADITNIYNATKGYYGK